MRSVKIITLDVLLSGLFLIIYLPVQFIRFLDNQADHLENWFDKMDRKLTTPSSRPQNSGG